jgi:biopolymer transport protein ExbD
MSGMAFRPRSGRKQIHLNVTSLIDVLFLLLIFFMLTGTFKRVGEMELRLPESTTSAPAAESPPGTVELVAAEDGRLLLDGSPIELPALKGRLRDILARDPGSRITIKAEEDVSHGRVVRLLDIVREAGFRGVGIGTEMEGGTGKDGGSGPGGKPGN